MKNCMISVLLVAAMSGLLLAAEVQIQPAPAPEGIQSLPVAPWVKAGQEYWQQAKPTFELAEDGKSTAATGWVAMSEEGILLHVVVKDDKHINDKTGDAIWMGDSIQLGVDALGVGMETNAMAQGVAAYGFALSDKGPQTWVYESADAKPGAGTNVPKIVRDDKAQTTTYDITLPWNDLHAAAGLAPVIGLAVQINDSNGTLDQTRLYWGKGVGGRTRPAAFAKVAAGTPGQALCAATVTREAIWHNSDCVEALFAVATDKPLTLKASLDNQTQQLEIPAAPLGEPVRRFVVRAYPQQMPEKPMAFKASIVDAGGKVLADAQAPVKSDARIIDELNARIETMIAQSPHPLFTRHLRSVQAIANTEWQYASLSAEKSTAALENAVKDIKIILAGLDGDAGKWETYLARQRKLVFAFVAKDRTVQPYSVLLPKDWKPEKTYPMVVFLHGSGGSPDALDSIVGSFEGAVSKPAASRFEGDFDMIYLEPFARGNYGYKDVAESDVYQSIDEVERMLKVDPDRTYLTGFSMGGMGTWALMLHTPDRWAAVVINAGGPRYEPVGVGLGRNTIGLPVRISHGDADRAVPVKEAHAMLKEIKDCGSDAELIILPGVGHEYYEKPWETANLTWLMKHKRTRPDHFAFTADSSSYLGRNGITMRRDVLVSSLPWFDCTVKGNEVTIRSEGSPQLDVNLGEGGLGLTGEAKVIWNGEVSYQGPAKKITLTKAGKIAAKSEDD